MGSLSGSGAAKLPVLHAFVEAAPSWRPGFTLLFHKLTGLLVEIETAQLEAAATGTCAPDTLQALYSLKLIVDEPVDVETVNLSGRQAYSSSAYGGPFEIIIETGLACNLACGYCYQGASHSGHVSTSLTNDRFDEALSIAADRAPQSLTISFIGGEPLLKPDPVLEAVSAGRRFARARDINFISGVSTNGTILTPEIVHNFNQIAIPLTLQGDHDLFRRNSGGVGTFEIIRRHLISLGPHFNDGGTELLLRYNAHRENVGQFAQFLEMVDALGIDNCIVKPHPINNYHGNPYIPTISPEEYFDLVDTAERWAMARGRKPRALPKPSYGTCSGHGGRRLKLRSDGSIALCNMDWQGANRVVPSGALREQFKLRLMEQAPRPSRKCSSCTSLPICGGPKLCSDVDLDGLSSSCSQLPFDLHRQMRLVAEHNAQQEKHNAQQEGERR